MNDLWVCIRVADSVYQGWCGTRHRFEDIAATHSRRLNTNWPERARWSPADFNRWMAFKRAVER